MKFILSSREMQSPKFLTILQDFIDNPNQITLELGDLKNLDDKYCESIIQKIVIERQHKTTLSISLSCISMDFLRVILTAIERNPNFSKVDFFCEGTVNNPAIAEISKFLTHSNCAIRTLSFELVREVDFNPIALALPKNISVTELRLAKFMAGRNIEVRLFDCIFKALGGNPKDNNEQQPSTMTTNTTVTALHLDNISIDYFIERNEPAVESLKYMFQNNQCITDFSFTTYSLGSESKRLGLNNSSVTRLSLDCFRTCGFPTDLSTLPPNLEVLELSAIRCRNPKEFINGLFQLIQECKNKNLTIHIILSRLPAEYKEVIKENEDKLKVLLADNEMKVTLECDDIIKEPVYKRNQAITFFNLIASVKHQQYECAMAKRRQPS